jgi:hypothetical protein
MCAAPPANRRPPRPRSRPDLPPCRHFPRRCDKQQFEVGLPPFRPSPRGALWPALTPTTSRCHVPKSDGASRCVKNSALIWKIEHSRRSRHSLALRNPTLANTFGVSRPPIILVRIVPGSLEAFEVPRRTADEVREFTDQELDAALAERDEADKAAKECGERRISKKDRNAAHASVPVNGRRESHPLMP